MTNARTTFTRPILPAGPNTGPVLSIASRTGKNSPKVFVVDDSAELRHTLAEAINAIPSLRFGGEAELASEALHGIRQCRPQIVFLDVALPGGGGLELLETIKCEQPHLWVIILTHVTHAAYRQRCLKLGAHGFFDKSTELAQALDLARTFPASRATALGV